VHEGAINIKRNKIVSAACYLPLSESTAISKELVTRHRAAIGISEVTDALTLIVSEETGAMSVTKNGVIKRDVDEKKLAEILKEKLIQLVKTPETNLINWRGKKNG